MPSEKHLKDHLADLGVEVAPECLAILTARNTTSVERHQCHLMRAYEIRTRAMKVEEDYQKNEAQKSDLQKNLMEGLMNDHQSVTKLVVGLRAKLATNNSPLGEHTGRFEDIADLALWLLFDASRAQKPWLKWWQFWK